MLTCVVCGKRFDRKGKHGPVPKYCSPPCISKAGRTPHRKAYEKLYIRAARAAGKRKVYERNYYRRPEVKARYLRRWRELYRNPFADVQIDSPYTGHPWMDKIRALAGPPPDESAPWADRYHDMIGEGLLAFLEGRDPIEAMDMVRKDYNHSEYRQVYFGQMENRSDDHKWEWMLPTPDLYDAPPAYEPEVMLTEQDQPVTIVTPAPMKWHRNKATTLRAARRKGSRGPNKSHKKFRGYKGDNHERFR